MVATQEKKRYLPYQVGSYVRLDREQEPQRVSAQSSEFFFMPSVFVVGIFILVTLPILTRCPNISIVNF